MHSCLGTSNTNNIAPWDHGADTEMIDSVKKQHKNLIGIEMESYAVFTACALADDPKPLCVSLKSVCDFGDSSKSDDYHHYASYTSAKVLTRFILDWFTKNS